MKLTVLKNFDALLITQPVNIRYLTGFVGAAPEERESYLLVTANQAFLFTNSVYLEQARGLELLGCYIVTLLKTKKPLEIIEISKQSPISRELGQVLTRLNLGPFQGSTFKGVRLGFEETDLTVAEYNKLKKKLKGITLVPTTNRIEELRMIKRKDEIENIRAAAKLTDLCFDFILKKLKVGVTEGKIAWEIESFFRKFGAESAFSPIVAFGKNSSIPHYNCLSCGAKKFQSLALKSTVVLLDFGARVNGYCADMTRVVFVGKPTEEWRRAYQTVVTSQQAVFRKLSQIYTKADARISGATLDRLARGIIKRAGFVPYPHSLGHNVGLDIHENPRLTIKEDSRLLPGMVFTVEPAIYKENQYGIRIEDLVLLKREGIEIISTSTKEMIVI